MAIRSFHQAIGMVGVRQQLGPSRRWGWLAAAAAMMWIAAPCCSNKRKKFRLVP